MIRLLATSGDSSVDRAIEDAIWTISPAFALCEVGYYLHGSAAARAMTSISEHRPPGDRQRGAFPSRREEANALVNVRDTHLDDRLDFKAFPWREFATDPWVDLRLPPIPESSMERPLHKYVGWFISALLASRHGHVPPNRHYALATLETFEPPRAVVLRGLHDTARRHVRDTRNSSCCATPLDCSSRTTGAATSTNRLAVAGRVAAGSARAANPEVGSGISLM